MKKISLILLPFLMIVYSCTQHSIAEIGQKTEITVNPVFNAGKVLHGEEIVATFELKNEGKYPLVISEVKGSCSCTVVQKPEKPVAPGQKGKITATVKTDNANIGKLSKEIRIIANTEPSITIMKINAEVYRK